jgi:hypothetical protein
MCRQFVNILERLVNPEIPVFPFAMKELKKARWESLSSQG